MSISVQLRTELVPVDSAPNIAGLSASKLVFDSYNTSANLNSASTPVVTNKAVFALTLTAGAGSIDLTALPDSRGTQDFTGLKIQSMKFQVPGANAMTVGKGASNGLGLTTGGTTWSIPLPPALANAPLPEVVLVTPEGTPDVDSTHKKIDVAGTGTDVLYCTIVAG